MRLILETRLPGPGCKSLLVANRMRLTGVLFSATIVAVLLFSASEAFLQSQIEAIRQPLRDLVGKRADELCLNCQSLECLFCYNDKL